MVDTREAAASRSFREGEDRTEKTMGRMRDFSCGRIRGHVSLRVEGAESKEGRKKKTHLVVSRVSSDETGIER